jgi:hypothetical protein
MKAVITAELTSRDQQPATTPAATVTTAPFASTRLATIAPTVSALRSLRR